ncbi:hypothetical protein CH063_10325, partial [Colletotrichum higginsianum]
MTLPLRDESSFCRPLYKVHARPLRSKSAYPPSIHFSPEGTTHSSDRLPHSTVSHTGCDMHRRCRVAVPLLASPRASPLAPHQQATSVLLILQLDAEATSPLGLLTSPETISF